MGQVMWGGADQGHVGQLAVGAEMQMLGGWVWGVPEEHPLPADPGNTVSRGLQVPSGLPPGTCSPQLQDQHAVDMIGEELMLCTAGPSSRSIPDAAMILS